MSETQNPNQLVEPAPDVAPLEWLVGEIRTSTQAAIAGVQEFLDDRSKIESLRSARSQVHVANGALQMLDLRGATLLLDAVEQLLKKWEDAAGDCTPPAVQNVAGALEAVVAYLEGLRSGRPDQPIRLFPHYRDILELVGATRVHPADLMFPDLTRRPAFHAIVVRPQTADQLRVRRARFEGALLAFLRDASSHDARRDMRDALADLESLPQRSLARTFWWVVRGLLDALEADAIDIDVDLKRVLARVNLQLRRLIEGGGAVAERLLIDALYYIGRADPSVARVGEARRLYGLDALVPPDFEHARLTLLDVDLVRALRDSLTETKSAWGQFVGGGNDVTPFSQRLAEARRIAAQISVAPIDLLLQTVDKLSHEFGSLPVTARETMSIEIATALLLVDLGVDQLPNLDERFEARADAMIARLQAARAGAELPAIEAWLTELARKAQDRLTMQTVVSEIQGMLREVEQRLDRFFREPAERAEIAAVDGIIEQMGSVLSLLGFDEVVAALANARQGVRRYTNPSVAADEADFSRLAGNLGAIGFFVETLGQDVERPRGMFRWDEDSGIFSANLAVARTTGVVDDFEDEYGLHAYAAGTAASAENVETAARHHLEQARDLARQLTQVPTDAATARQLEAVASRLVADADLLDDAELKRRASQSLQAVKRLLERPDMALALELMQILAPAPVEPNAPTLAATPLPQTQDAADEELMEIFVEEANEVLDGIDQQLGELRVARSDKATMTTVRRAFHTLKGSSRMVGLKLFGEGAWSVEQCFNAWLAQERAATDDLINLAAAAQGLMRDWIRQIKREPAVAIDPQPLVLAANLVRDGQPFAIEESAYATPAAETITAAEPAVAITTPLEEIEIPTLPLTEQVAMDEPAVAATAEADVEEIAAVADEAVIDSDFTPAVEVPAEMPQSLLQEATEQPATDSADASAPADADAAADDDVRHIGPVSISHGLYSAFLSEADESIRALTQDIAEWRFEPQRTVSSNALRRAHSLAGITATVGLESVWDLADPLDDLLHEMSRVEHATHPVFSAAQFDTLERHVERIRGMLHQFAAGIYPPAASSEANPVRELLDYVRSYRALAAEDHEPVLDRASPEMPLEVADLAEPETVAAGSSETPGDTIPATPAEPATAAEPAAPAESVTTAKDDATTSKEIVSALAAAAPAPQAAVEAAGEAQTPLTHVADDIDADLLPVFLAEATDLLPAVGSQLRALAASPSDRAPMRELMRLLHTVKGSARMTGAMRLGELVHDMETRIEAAMQLAEPPRALIDDLHGQYDEATALFDAMQRGESTAPAAVPAAQQAATPLAEMPIVAPAAMPVPAQLVESVGPAGAGNYVRVRSDVLDKLVDQAGEVLISRSRVENHTTTLKSSLVDLTENIQRLRTQMRELEIQAEAQIQARSERLSRESATFDPLEFDRFTRLQELTRMIAESIEDVATIQGSMLKGLQTTEGDLSAQYRLTRELQQQLMRVRLVPFASVSERLYRLARQTGKELDKRVNVDIRGGRTELDRAVLERMAGPFEHMVRNAIVHGIESPAARRAVGKPEVGELRIEVRQESNEIIIVVADDGAGLDLARIRQRAQANGLLRADQNPSDRELMDLIFAAGFSTATEVSELAGRGVGLDVVRSELSAFGGRIAIGSEAGRGTRFTLNLPLTLAVTQVVLASVGGRRYAIPAGMVEQVKRVRPETVADAIAEGMIDMVPVGQVTLRTMAQLLGEETTLHQGRQVPVILLRSGDDRMAVMADEVSSNQEVVVKNVGAQVSRLAGILGATILGNGEIVLIINPVQLIVRAPEPPQLSMATSAVPLQDSEVAPTAGAETGVLLAAAPVIMVVDDSLTVRRVTQRLLERSGYEVILAKDGVDALRQLQDTVPAVMLVDIEMPRMDGFDLTRNVRATAATRSIPIIMITSRTADKHRRLAMELGVNAYLGKPYQEDELLSQIKSYLAERAMA